ncbi:hypothetical protein [Aquimarina sp. RZ0]|uniref:hypothetical protein n=1 Tax=Aquimarina sp. RZ0 TaxID=2607730 RepID=UPI0011F3E6BD|nr:hypothetical protein [Aquimarina sp. RZ0]KAA1240784.1 hypothetical protein F0000_26855 [Aquimarina sp. RZ0]
MNRYLILILLSLFLVSCKKETKKEPVEIKNKIEVVEKKSVQENNPEIPIREFSDPINLTEIKNLEFLTTTSGVVPHSELESLCKQNEEGFYGFYHLINKNKKYWMMGLLTVYVTDKPESWKFNSKNETLSMLELKTDDIKVWDSISIGISQSKLLDFIGTSFHYKKGSTLYAELGEYKSSFTMSKDTVSGIKIVKSCKEKSR